MTPEKILSHKPKALTQAQRQFYFDNGYLLVERIIPQDWVERLIDVTGWNGAAQPFLGASQIWCSIWNRVTRQIIHVCGV